MVPGALLLGVPGPATAKRGGRCGASGRAFRGDGSWGGETPLSETRPNPPEGPLPYCAGIGRYGGCGSGAPVSGDGGPKAARRVLRAWLGDGRLGRPAGAEGNP